MRKNHQVWKFLPLLVFFAVFTSNMHAQTVNKYHVSFENLKQNEAEITATFTNLNEQALVLKMARSSPGRYALHEFAKNVYNVEAFDGQGNKLPISRPSLHQWDVSGHDGTVVFKYTLYGNHGDGTYAQFDDTHAHMNVPATFITTQDYGYRAVEITFDIPEDKPEWQVATQLKHLDGNTYYAPDDYYFMDSPIEIADLHIREAKREGQTIRIALHSPATDAEIDTYFDEVMKIVDVQTDVFGELPDFDYGDFTFLLCYVPNATGDGMEHRNSTYVTASKPLEEPLGDTGLRIVSHEFIHVWNTERLRPRSLEPFDFNNANMSGDLWFSEGFTNYYMYLAMLRSGLLNEQQYLQLMAGTVGIVINSPGREYFNPIEMSYQAPFTDAARAVDANNRANTFISYYTYGSVLGFGLDLMLRDLDENLNLDDFMKLMWQRYGKTEIPYTVTDIQAALADYVNEDFAKNFFDNFIFDSKLPDYPALLDKFGVTMELQNPNSPDLGGNILYRGGKWQLFGNPRKGSALYEVGVNTADEFVSIGGVKLQQNTNIREVLAQFKPGDSIEVVTNRWNEERKHIITLQQDQTWRMAVNKRANDSARENRNKWLFNGAK